MRCQDTYRPKSQQSTLNQPEISSWEDLGSDRQNFEIDFCAALSTKAGSLPDFSNAQSQNFWRCESACLGASVSPSDPSVGFVGWLAADTKDTRSLLELLRLAEQWLRKRGVSQVVGPVNGSIWHTYRVTQLESAPDQPLFDWEPPYLAAIKSMLEVSGYRTVDSFHSTGFLSKDFSPALRILKPHYERALAAGFKIRSLRSGAGAQRDLQAIYEISVTAFADSELFHPLSSHEFQKLYSGVLAKDSRPTFILEDDSGEIQGFLFAFIERELVIVKSLATRLSQEKMGGMRRWSPANGMLYAALRTGSELGLDGAVSALVRDGATSRFMERYQKWAAAWRRTYLLLGKELVDGD